jgi:hypothetical protein
MMRTPERINDDVDTIFISSRALKRWTFPRYIFLDHVRLDDALREVTYGADIGDAWLPFFAMATDLSASAPYCFAPAHYGGRCAHPVLYRELFHQCSPPMEGCWWTAG